MIKNNPQNQAQNICTWSAPFFQKDGENLFSRCKSQPVCYTAFAMADNNDLIQQFRTVVREEIKAEIEPIKKGMATKADIQRVEQTQAQHGTILEALAAGQKELQETVATKADVLNVGVKVDKLRKRIEGIEEHTGSSTHRNGRATLTGG
jgi:hypothetical protein